MKHLFITALLAAACTLGASAQSIEVTDNQGLTYKFAADRVKDISFTKTTAADVINFSKVEARAYSSGAIETEFTSEDNTKSVTLWIVGPSMSKYLYDGVYNVETTSNEMTIDADKNYSFVTQDNKKTALKSGTMTVASTGKDYTITFDLTLEDDTELKGKYIGQMPGYVGKDFTLNTCQEPKVKTTEVNDYVDGEFYFNMNDESWSYEMALDFYSAAGSAKLPAGTYTYSDDKTAGTFSSRSYLDIYNPSNSYKFAAGSTVTVSYDGDNISLQMNLITDDGRKIDMKYEGKISFPEVVQTKQTVELATSETPKVIDNNGRVDGEFYTKFNDANWNYEMAIDFFANASETKIPAGKYTFSADNTPGTFGSKSYCDLYKPNLGNCRFAEGSTVDVSYSGDNIVMDFNLIIDGKDYVLTMRYEGPVTYEF